MGTAAATALVSPVAVLTRLGLTSAQTTKISPATVQNAVDKDKLMIIQPRIEKKQLLITYL
jgi:hypothetical protein